METQTDMSRCQQPAHVLLTNHAMYDETDPITNALLNTLTSIQGFYRVFGSIPVGRLAGTIKGPFKSTRYCLEG